LIRGQCRFGTLRQERRVVVLLNRSQFSKERPENSGDDEPSNDDQHRQGERFAVLLDGLS